MEPPTTPSPVPRPPRIKLEAEPPVGAGIILVRQTPDGAFAWATASTVTRQAATGTSDHEPVAYLAALSAFLDEPEHASRRLSLDVEDTPASLGLVRLVTDHLPHIPVSTRSDFHAQDHQVFSSVRNALLRKTKPRTEKKAEASPPPTPSHPVRIVAATATSYVPGQREIGWAWVTNEGRCKAGTFAAHRLVSVEAAVLLRAIAAHRDAHSIDVGAHSKQAIAMVQAIHTKQKSVKAVRAYLALEHHRFDGMFDILVNHQATITIPWLDDDPRHLLGHAAERLAAHARQGAQGELDPVERAAMKATILDQLLADLRERERGRGGSAK